VEYPRSAGSSPIEERRVPQFTVENVGLRRLAKTIDHSLLRPELDLGTVLEGVRLAVRYDRRTCARRPSSSPGPT
jgi:hypothetical protein